MSPTYQDVADLVKTSGVVEPITEFQARANFPGIVETIPVTLGDTVVAGQLLVTMKDPFAKSRVATAESAVSAAEASDQDIMRGGTAEERIALDSDLAHATAAQDQARHSLDLLQELQLQGAVSNGEVEAARKRLDDATVTLHAVQQRATRRFSQAAVKASHARLSDANASLGAAKIAFENAYITSPIAGTVYWIAVSPYDFAPMGADLLRVADLRRMQIRAYFDEPEVGKLKEGQDVLITWEGRPQATWHGKIRRAPVAAILQGDRSVAECLIQVDDSKGDLLPNTHVLVTVTIDKHPHVLSIPRQALQVDGNQYWVYRVVAGETVRTPVSIGLVNLDLVEIKSGLTTSDLVVLRREDHEWLTDHLFVRMSK